MHAIIFILHYEKPLLLEFGGQLKSIHLACSSKKKPTSLGFPRHILFSIISPEKNTEKWTFTLDFQTSNSSDGITFAYQETPEKFSMHLSGSCVDLLHFGFQPDILCGNRLFTLNTSWYKVLKMPRLLE